MNVERAKTTAITRLRGLMVLLALTVVASSPCLAQLEVAWNASSCKSCHRAPINAKPGDPSYNNNNKILSSLTERFSTSWCTTGAGVGTTMCGSYSSYFSSSDNDTLSKIYDYVVAARDAVVSVGTNDPDKFPSFGLTSPGASASQLLTITNYRNEPLDLQPKIAAGASDFSVASGSCTVVTPATFPPTYRVGAATATSGDTSPTSCNVTVGFSPSAGAPASREGSLQVTFSAGSTVQPRTRNDIRLSGSVALPDYQPTGFDAFGSPGFTAPTNGTSVICRTITNVGTAALSISLSSAQASGAGTNYSNYYEIADIAACGGSGLPGACVASVASIAGSTSLPAGTEKSCTLPIRFNPSKFGFGGGTGARSAKLVVTHNAPTAGTLAEYILVGNVTSGPEPAIGITTTPSKDASNRVLPAEFASQVINSSSAMWNQFIVSNSGSADGLDITQVSQSNSSEFQLAENCVAAPPLARLSGGTPKCTISLTFKPTALGQRCTKVTVRAAFSSNGDQSVEVCGNGVPVPVAQMTVSTNLIAFGNRAIGAIYLPASLTIANAPGATAALQLGAIGIAGGGFAFVPDASPCQNRALAAGTSCTLQLQFTPSTTLPGAAYAADLTIASNDPTTPNRIIVMSGTAVAYSVPELQWQGLASTALSFSALVIAGQMSPLPLTARLANPAGPGAVDLDAIRLVGADASSFKINSCPARLNQGEFCDIAINFAPSSGGSKTAQLEVVPVNGAAPSLLNVTGLGVGGVSPFLVTSGDLKFGSVRVGARSEPQALKVAAAGDGVIKVTGLTASEPFSIVSQSCPPLPFVLTLGSECAITVVFTPTSTSTSSGTLRIASDSATATHDVRLTGDGQSAADVSNGGCSMTDGRSPTDPTLWSLVLLAIVTLYWRQRRRGSHHARQEDDSRLP